MIKITDKYFVEIEPMCYSAKKTNINEKTGEPYSVSLGFYNTFAQAVQKVMNEIQKEKLGEKDMDLKEAVDILKATNIEFYKFLYDEIGKNEELKVVKM